MLLKRGVYSCAELQVFSCSRGMSGNARDFNIIEMRAVIKFPAPLQSKATKEIHAILKETLGEHAPSYTTIKNWVAQLNVVIFPPVMRLILDNPKQ